MRNETGVTEAAQQYAAAHRRHYETKDLRRALELYAGIIAAHSDTREAGYSRSQIQNIVRTVVPKQELFNAQVGLASAYLEQAAPAWSPTS